MGQHSVGKGPTMGRSRDDHGAGHESGHPPLAVHRTATWFQTNGVEFTVGTLVDGPAVMMFLVVTLVSLLVHVYSTDYVHGTGGTPTSSPSSRCSVLRCSCWAFRRTPCNCCAPGEMVGVCSFALIGHWWEEKPNRTRRLRPFPDQPCGGHGPPGRCDGVFFFAAGSALPGQFGSFSIAETNALANSGALSHTGPGGGG
ncbi:MAG: hypothetical protein Ct9H300mP12_12090 [Acidimicrobiales bacterium]|nr:MAG: hypothetical protein Ct9H300mP12_12090 [Acidimicrobiales bacterium]